MKNLGWIVALILTAIIANSQSINGVGLGNAVATVSACTPAPGAAVTLCPVTGDGLYLAVGSGTFSKIVTGSAPVPVFTKVNCSTATQSNTGFVGSSCVIN